MDEFIKILKMIKGTKRKKAIHDAQKLRDNGANQSTLARMNQIGLIKSYSSDYYIEQPGYFMLYEHNMTVLTHWILGFTIANLIFITVQILLSMGVLK